MTQEVQSSQDFKRIRDLPRRTYIATDDFSHLKIENPNCQCKLIAPSRNCAKELFPVQAQALSEAKRLGGGFDPIGVGHGKTLPDLLVAMVLLKPKQTAVLLVPPMLRNQLLEIDWKFYSQHWKLPNLVSKGFHHNDRPFIWVLSYSELSNAKKSDILDLVKPDLIIADEAHNLKDPKSARTKRFLRYFQSRPQTMFCCWSGTMTSRSLFDYAHLSNTALKEGSPTPKHYPTVKEWAAAVDPTDFPIEPGVLGVFCERGESVRDGFRRRIIETGGVVASSNVDGCEASIILSERALREPPEIERARNEIASKWQRPDNEELTDALAVMRCKDELSNGFFYRWKWPKDTIEELKKEWLEARKEWYSEVREKLKHAKVHMDSPKLVTQAAIRHHRGYKGPKPTWEAQCYLRWEYISKKVKKPPTEAVWISDFLLNDAAEWLKENIGIVWYEHVAFGEALAKKTGITFYNGGEENSVEINRETGKRSIIASIKSHGTGKHLQMFEQCLITSNPTSGETWEQLIGRLHRPNQKSDTVEFTVYGTDFQRNKLVRAMDRAKYMMDTFGQTQKLLKATHIRDSV